MNLNNETSSIYSQSREQAFLLVKIATDFSGELKVMRKTNPRLVDKTGQMNGQRP